MSLISVTLYFVANISEDDSGSGSDDSGDDNSENGSGDYDASDDVGSGVLEDRTDTISNQ